jgi:hypothetical protein
MRLNLATLFILIGCFDKLFPMTVAVRRAAASVDEGPAERH